MKRFVTCVAAGMTCMFVSASPVQACSATDLSSCASIVTFAAQVTGEQPIGVPASDCFAAQSSVPWLINVTIRDGGLLATITSINTSSFARWGVITAACLKGTQQILVIQCNLSVPCRLPQECKVSVERWGQCAGKDEAHHIPYAPFPAIFPDADGHWGAEPYALHVRGDGGTMCKSGCGTTALSMALTTAGAIVVPTVDGLSLIDNDPGHLDDFMALWGMSGYTRESNVNWGAAVADVSFELGRRAALPKPVVFVGAARKLLGFVPKVMQTAAHNFLDDALCRGIPVIVLVPSPSNPAAFPSEGHFLLVTGQNGDDYDIADPAENSSSVNTPRHTLLSQYQDAFGRGAFEIRGYVEDPEDASLLNLSTGSKVHLVVVDALGRRKGKDAGATFDEIPRAYAAEDSITDDESGGTSTEISRVVNVYQPVNGAYKAIVTGIASGPYVVDVRGFASSGEPQPAVSVAGVSAPGSSSSFDIQFSAEPGTATSVARVTTFDGTLADIQNSLLAGLIDNEGVARSLTQKIGAAQAAIENGRILTGRNILEAFKNEVRAQTGKHIAELAAQILLEDADYLLKQ